MTETTHIAKIIRSRIDQAKPEDHSIPNGDVRLLLLEIDNLNSLIDDYVDAIGRSAPT